MKNKIDIDHLEYHELLELSAAAKEKAQKMSSKNENKIKKEFMQSETFKDIRDRFRELNKEFKSLLRNHTVTLTVPIKLDISLENDHGNLYDLLDHVLKIYGEAGYNYELGRDDLFYNNLAGSILSKGGNLDPVQKRQMEYVIDIFVEEMDDLMDSLELAPDLWAKVDDLVKRVNKAIATLHQTMAENKIKYKDLK